MPQRRSPFGYGDGGESMGTNTTPMPMTGTGTDNTNMYSTEFENTPGAIPAETPASMRRRLMPVAGSVDGGMGALDFVQQMVQRRKVGM